MVETSPSELRSLPSAAGPSRAARKTRREKPRLALAPDQPMTTQGKPRARVYVACAQCRNRKVRCDGAKPACYNCEHRATGDHTCTYDSIPKRRGPDRTPGSRQRVTRDGVSTPAVRPSRSRRKQLSQEDSGTDNGPEVSPLNSAPQLLDLLTTSSALVPPTLQSLSPSTDHTSSPIEYSHKFQPQGYIPTPEISSPEESYYAPRHISRPRVSSIASVTNTYVPSPTEVRISGRVHSNYSVEAIYSPATSSPPHFASYQSNDNDSDNPNDNVNFVVQPTLDFNRKTWWDSLLSLYTGPGDPVLGAVTNTQREQAAHRITQDIRFLFKATNYWFSFFHVPTFFSTFFEPKKRDTMQPSLVLAILAVSTFFQSSEVGMKQRGREFAIRLRNEAQGALEASYNLGWLDETLAQAAWLLAMFEISAHPDHTAQRAVSALVLLDNIIRSMHLTHVDDDNPGTTHFSPSSTPALLESPVSDSGMSDAYSQYNTVREGHPRAQSGCSCANMTLARHWPEASDHCPNWLATPAWSDTWNEAEIRRESCRRLCWSAVTLAAGHSSYARATKNKGLYLYITDPSNLGLLFSGEGISRSPLLVYHPDPKDTIWALYDRAFLLWHSCVTMRDSRISESEKAEFSVKAWIGADALENALGRHTCDLDRAFLFQAREYIFNSRMCISYEFQSYIPVVSSTDARSFYRRTAEEWLSHQRAVAARFMYGLGTITGYSNHTLVQRPFFVWWFFGQVLHALSLWERDNTLTIALETCCAFLPAIDFLTALWPCSEQRIRYDNVRSRLALACAAAGLPPISTPKLTVREYFPQAL